MPKLVPEMSDAAVRRLRHRGGKAAVYAVGGVAGLLLVCKPPVEGQEIGARSWILRTTIGGKRRDIGLGGYPTVTLSMARTLAREARDKIRQGVDPIAERKALRSALSAAQSKAITFRQVAEEYIAKKAAEYKGPKQTYKLTQQLTTYAYPHIGNLVVSDIERAHIVKMLEPIWSTKHETAYRVRLHVERVLDLAGVKGLRKGDNPARWKGNLELSFAAGHKVAPRQHHNALPIDDMPAFWRDLFAVDTQAANVLRFLILTAARPGEARGVCWAELDLKAKLWIVPPERMKGGRQHKVPLTTEAIKLVRAQPRLNEYVFPGPNGNPLSDVAVSKLPKGLGHDVTAHGFRAVFRTWAQEHTAYPEEVAELALAHVNSDRTRVAYARSELVDQRRQLMRDWERFILNGHTKRGGKVVSIGGRKA